MLDMCHDTEYSHHATHVAGDAICMDAAIEYVWEDTEKWVYSIVHEFIRHHGGDFHELLANASIYFVRAHQSYDSDFGSWTNWVRYKVWKGLIDDLRNEMRWRERNSQLAEIDALMIEGRGDLHFSLGELLAQLSSDAVIAIHFALNPPPKLRLVADINGGGPDNIRAALRQHLRSELNWSHNRVRSVMEEIRGAL